MKCSEPLEAGKNIIANRKALWYNMGVSNDKKLTIIAVRKYKLLSNGGERTWQRK
ncbi:hypothetical protein [Parablautia intestinalis]|jgi:hypothetical protein|uniref:hypothetical protein n=1 Tax=Parablautia intestinalis TaxID=2320100 RepID=UPI0023C173EB|nr:hypothetical protein [Parablautia intestinalis]MCI8614597.1 hypothetical protein [Lachnospiraceae bacterium]MDE7047641.1 hypothetical protein [Lachnospiraceae bacterium]